MAVGGIGLAVALALGACSSQMDPDVPTSPPSTTSSPTSMVDSLSALSSVAGPESLMIIGTNGSALVGLPDAPVHFYNNSPAEVSATASEFHVAFCSVELDALVMPPAAPADIANSLAAARAKCDQEDLAPMLAELRALQTPMIEVIVGDNAAETWHSTNGGVNFFYNDDILGMLHAARQLNVAACVISPNDLALPMYPGGLTPGLSISDALASCGLPP